VISRYGDGSKLKRNKAKTKQDFYAARNKFGADSPQAKKAMSTYKSANDALVKYDQSGAEGILKKMASSKDKYSSDIASALGTKKIPTTDQLSSIMSNLSDLGQVKAKEAGMRTKLEAINSMDEDQLAKLMGE